MITQDRLKALVSYDTDTGLFYRKVLSRGQGNTTTPIGSNVGNGYLDASIDGRRYYLHRLAMIYVNGSVGDDMDVDHKNHIKSDNRFENLREVPHSVNQQNQRKAKKSSMTGLLGVTYRKKIGAYVAQISISGVNKHIGCYATADLAHEAYVTAKRAFHEGNTL